MYMRRPPMSKNILDTLGMGEEVLDGKKAWQYAEEILLLVSRTFALNINVLKGKLHKSILLAYLYLRIADTVYVAIVNYSSSSSMSGRLPLDLLGIDEQQCTAVRELWFGNDVNLSNASLPYVVPAKDARIYRITLADTDGVETAQHEPARCWLDGHSLWVKTSEPLSNVTVYSTSGTRLAYVSDVGGTFRIPFERVELPSVLLVQICFANGLVLNKKIRA